MSETCETVTIVNNAGVKIIMNKSDYDASVHKLYKEEEEIKAGSKADLQAQCEEAGIEYDSKSTKADLEMLLQSF